MTQVREKKKRKDAGQVIIEFIFVVMIILSLIFVFIQMAWGIAMGHYIQYATFMSARAYLAASIQKTDQRDNAMDSLNSYVKKKGGSGGDILPFVARARTADQRDASACAEDIPGACIGAHPKLSDDIVNNSQIRIFSWMEGVQYSFEVPLYLLPIGPVAANQKGKQIGIQIDGQTKNFTWTGAIPLTSDAWLGRETSMEECWLSFMAPAVPRNDGGFYIEDNGC